MSFILHLLELLTPYGNYAYVGIFSVLLLCGFGLPLPEDVVLVTGGILASRGIIQWEYTHAVSLIGVLLGDSIIFFLGQKGGPTLFQKPLFQKWFPPKRVSKIQHWFETYGNKVVFFARFAPGLRMPLFLSSGAFGIPLKKFLFLDGLAAIVSVPVWIWAGYTFGSNLEALHLMIQKMQWTLYLALFGLLLVFMAIWWVKKKIQEKF